MFEAIDTTIRIEVPRDIPKSFTPFTKEADNAPKPGVENRRNENSENVLFSQDFLNDLEQRFDTPHNVQLQFSFHEPTGRIMARVFDMNTQELIREIPREEVLDLAAKIDEMVGILIDKNA
jgi:flagellar protein FlaG